MPRAGTAGLRGLSAENMRNSVSKKKLSTWIPAAAAALLIGLCLWLIPQSGILHSDGFVTVTVKDLDGSVVRTQKLAFREGDTLVGLVEEHFEGVTVTDGMLMSIEGLTTPADWSYFLTIYRNGEMSSVGIEALTFTDGDVIEFVMTEFRYE